MIDLIVPNLSSSDMVQDFINRTINTTKQVISCDAATPGIINSIMNLSASITFFEDLHKYHKEMNLSDESLENFILSLDDLIDEFEDFEYATSSNKYQNEYNEKARYFYDLLVKTQIELGFYLSDRKYKI